MKVTGNESLSVLSYIQQTSSLKTDLETGNVISKKTNYDTVQISASAQQKLNESRKNAFIEKYPEMEIYTVGYDEAISKLEAMVIEKENDVDLPSCGPLYLMLFHKTSIDTSLSTGNRKQIQHRLEEGYVHLMQLRAEKEGWETGKKYDQSSRDTIIGMGDKAYYNEFTTPIFESILEGDFDTALKFADEYYKVQELLSNGLIDDEEAAKRIRELTKAKERQRQLDFAMENLKSV